MAGELTFIISYVNDYYLAIFLPQPGRIRKGIAAMAPERSMDIMSDKASYSKKKKFLMQSNTSLYMFKALLLVL
ncbi:hypothetical protein NECAME_13879 [Necator americanus]|uniref:Uncharacterized protein n=1 Tax=Necator americanus TaxID=51031 RepID=W2SU97_NECAM|nr:hypothetical protein NECAME_13879 [Necator americanus]ETN72411.1 hypothetical protein NECAME_13879 [Necator americanus]